MGLYELRKTVARTGSVRLVTREALNEEVGFRSCYSFLEAAVSHIKATNTTAGLKGMDLYTDELLVDFDDQPEAANDFEKLVSNYNYEMYDSGGRSIHFHVKLTPMVGPTVPESQREWMRVHAPKSDISIYKTSGMYRLPGTFHAKHRGRFKQLLKSVSGPLLTIPIIEVKEYFTPSDTKYGSHDEDKEYILMRLLVTNVTEGTKGRNNHIFLIAAVCRDLDMPQEACANLLHKWNIKRCSPPLQQAGIYSTIRSAYRR